MIQDFVIPIPFIINGERWYHADAIEAWIKKEIERRLQLRAESEVVICGQCEVWPPEVFANRRHGGTFYAEFPKESGDTDPSIDPVAYLY